MEILNLLSNLDGQIASFIALHGNLIYLLLFLIVFLEIGVFPLFFLPGNPLIFIAGSFCKLGALSLIPTVTTLIVAIILGNLFTYQIGKLFGDKISRSNSPWANKNALDKTRLFYAKYGTFTLMVSPFIAMVRTFAPLLAGVSHMSYRQYLFSSTIGAILWIGILVSAGYFFSSISFVQEHMASIVLSGLAIGIGFVIYGFFRSKKLRITR
ncbi:MAG: VTT domain-containing protein [Betaproteobacteria bacterium]|nr:VTT domain-containing protein [Betaproteobacteria bacterium]